MGVFEVVAANGQSFTVSLGDPGNEAFTVGDVIDRINDAASERGVTVVASINGAGTGIELEDLTGGGGELTVNDFNGSLSPAADLNLIRTAADDEQFEIDGAGLFSSTQGEQARSTRWSAASTTSTPASRRRLFPT